MTNSITKNSARHEPKWAYVDFDYSNIDGANFNAAIELPANSVVIGGSLVVKTGFTSAVLDGGTPPAPQVVHATIGDASVADRYLSSTSLAATGHTPLVPTGFVDTGVVNLGVTLDFQPNAGAARLGVKYIQRERQTSSQG